MLLLSLVACFGEEPIETERLSFDGLITETGDQRKISERATSLEGEVVEMEGFISPMTPFIEDFFYFVNSPSYSCPFCAGEEVDLLDIVQVYYPPEERFGFTFDRIKVIGTLEVGEKTDTEGHPSFFRIRAIEIEEK